MVLDDGMRIFDYAVVVEVWGIDRTESGVPLFELRHCSVRRRPITTDAAAHIRATHGLGGLTDADLVIVPGSGHPTRPPNPAVLTALRAAHHAHIPIAALCGGTFVLAQAGLLQHRQATTHWLWADELRHRFPDVKVQQEALFVEDNGVWTSAGTAAGIDLCLHLVREAHGAQVAATIARRMVTMPHRAGNQRQYIGNPVPGLPSGDDPLVEIIAWAREHLHEPLTVRQLATCACMSERTFARQFVRLTGTTPLQWLHHQRIQFAQHLLESTNLSVESIAHRVGFGSTSVLRRYFSRTLGTTPTAHRRAFHIRTDATTGPSQPVHLRPHAQHPPD